MLESPRTVMLVSSAGIAGFAGGALFAPEKMDEMFLNEEARCAKNEVPYSFMGHALGTCHAHAHVFIYTPGLGVRNNANND